MTGRITTVQHNCAKKRYCGKMLSIAIFVFIMWFKIPSVKKLIPAIILLPVLMSCETKKKIPVEDLRIVMLGDSETRRINHYWGPDTNWNTLTGYKHIFNLGFDGYTTKDLLYFKRDSVTPVDLTLKKKPHIVFLMAGINDAGQSKPLSNTLSNIRAIIDTMQTHGIEIVVQSVIPTTSSYDTLYGGFSENGVIAKRVKEMNDSLKQICISRKIPFLNVQSRMLVSNMYLNNALSVDGIHLNYKGYVIWKDCLKKYISSRY